MFPTAKPGLIVAASLAGFLACAAAGCGSTPPRDQNFGTDLGADYRAPIVDAASDAATGGAGGGAVGGQGGAGGENVTDLAGAAGTAGDGGVAGAGGAATGS